MNRREAFQKMALGMGYVVSLPTISTILNSCYPGRDMGELVFLTNEEAMLLEDIGEVIFPETPSAPGAKSAGVIPSVDLLLKHLLTIDNQVKFRTALKEFSEGLDEEFNKMDEASQIQAISDLAKREDAHLFKTIKRMTLLGYFTQESIGKNVMNYNPLPGSFDPCIEIDEDARGWYM